MDACKNLKGLMAGLRRDKVKRHSNIAAGTSVTVALATEPGETVEEPGPASPSTSKQHEFPPPNRKSEHRRGRRPAANNKEWLNWTRM